MKTHIFEKLVNDLQTIVTDMQKWAEESRNPTMAKPMDCLEAAATQVSIAWSGSNFGYHSRVYYDGFVAPPPGNHFSSEWGLYGTFRETTGYWREYAYGDVIKYMYQCADNPDLTQIRATSHDAGEAFEEHKANFNSIIIAFLAYYNDEFLVNIKLAAEKLTLLTQTQAIKMQLPTGTLMSRDTLAMTQGLQSAPHQEILGEVLAIHSVFIVCSDLGKLASRAAAHIERMGIMKEVNKSQGVHVFIGHGRSPLWRELKDFINDRLHLPWEEFNRVPVAGVTNIARLAQMLDSSGIAFLVLTAEDERTDGATIARQNVIHEAGLFQGRLGFTRAIVLLEEGCEVFSNIQGLGHIRFPPGRIQMVFEEVRRVLEREGFINT